MGRGVNTQDAFTKAGSQVGSQFASAEFEAEADYVGLYYSARSGYDTAHAPEFLRKMSVENSGSIFIKSSHPANPQRFLALQAANTEIEAQRTAGEPLPPKRKDKSASASAQKN